MSKVRQAAVQAYIAFTNAVVGPMIGDRCPVCGRRTILRRRDTLHPSLVKDWQLPVDWERWFNAREFDYCLGCHATRRDRGFATALIAWTNTQFGTSFSTLGAAVDSEPFRTLRIAEINSIGTLHPWLAKHPNLSYSEFGSADATIKDENILALSYDNEMFDLVLTSETLEHVPDFPAAQREIYRVLKPGGTHLFTIPVIWDRPNTLQRATIDGGRIVHHESTSFHGAYDEGLMDWLVFYEFGRDVASMIEQAGFDLTVHRDTTNPALIVFEAVRSA